MTKEKFRSFYNAHRLRAWRIRTKLLLLILVMAAASLGGFWFLWSRQIWFCEAMEKVGIMDGFDCEEFAEKLREEAVKYTVPESEEDIGGKRRIEPFFDSLCDEYTGMSVYGKDGIYRCGRMAESMGLFRYGSVLSQSIELLGEIVDETQAEFANGTYQVVFYSYHRMRFTYPFVTASVVFCVLFFLSGILLYINRVLGRVLQIKEAITVMAVGDLKSPVPWCGEDEVGVLAEELDLLRRNLDENIQKEQESKKANQDLITAISHDLRTPLTVLNGYLEVLKLKRGDAGQQEQYIERCLRKTEDIRVLTDRMFEYALVYEENETPELRQLPLSVLNEILEENCDFITLAGFHTGKEIRIGNEDGNGTLLGDKVMLKRIFSNLFSNILKYGDKRETVIVRAVPDQGRIRITLTNTVKKDAADIESNRIGLKSVEKMVKIHQGELYVMEEGSAYTVQIRLKIRN